MFNKKLLLTFIVVFTVLLISAIAVSAQQGTGTCPYNEDCPCYGYGTGSEAGDVPCGSQMGYRLRLGHNFMGWGNGNQHRHGNHNMGEECPLLDTDTDG
jgi:hypothetical protein